jgi:hypothetical protein
MLDDTARQEQDEPAKDADDHVDEDRQQAGNRDQRAFPAAYASDVEGDRIGDSERADADQDRVACDLEIKGVAEDVDVIDERMPRWRGLDARLLRYGPS